MPTKLHVLRNLSVGERVAEEESDQLSKYFVETDQWQQLLKGEIDVVYGAKGTGKSALYTLLKDKESELFDKRILVSLGENVRGAPVFRTLTTDPPPNEASFIYLWKLYFLVIISRTLREFEVRNGKSLALIESLEKVGLLPVAGTLPAIFRAVTKYFRGWLNRDVASVEYALSVDPTTGVPSVSRKSEFRQGTEQQNLDDIPIDELAGIACDALDQAGFQLWILLDRLDVAFVDSPTLERNALRALFRTYNDWRPYQSISLKIFVRDDIWRRITEGGFTEASHITKTTTIAWEEGALLHLALLRLLNSQSFTDFYGVQAEETRGDYDKQVELFYRAFPQKIESGRNPPTFRWIAVRTSDASNKTAPRELIHFLESLKDLQIKRLERGEPEPDGEQLFDRSIFKEALAQVSKARYEQTLLAEYPDFKQYLDKLEGEKAEQSLRSLTRLWGLDESEAGRVARRLTEVGFFDERTIKGKTRYWIPFLYRSALKLVQGKAD